MLQEEKTKQAWNFYVRYPATIYLFNIAGKLSEEELKTKLLENPISLSQEEAEGMYEQIKENPLFICKDGFFEIDKEMAFYVVKLVSDSFCLDSPQKHDEELHHLREKVKELSEKLENQEKRKEKPIVVKDVIATDSTGKEIFEGIDNQPIGRSEKPLINGFVVPAIENLHLQKDLCNLKDYYKDGLEIINQGMEFVTSMLGLSKKEKKKRREEILKELTDENNQKFAGKTALQKLIYYVSFNPDITVEQKETILDAAKNGLDAKVILNLMETDKELFSIEYFDFMIELAKQQSEARLMTDLAKRLILGEWVITAKVDGVNTKFALKKIPIDKGGAYT